MSNILTVAFSGEGTSDERFMVGIVQRTFEALAVECETDIEVFPTTYFPPPHLGDVRKNYEDLARKAFASGIQILCIHADADGETDENVLKYKFAPALEQINKIGNDKICKNLVEVIPVHMTEAWMLADKDILKEEIGTTKPNQTLGLARDPETIADPKGVIIEALRVAQAEYPVKRKKIGIGALYQPLGQKISLTRLDALSSYSKFKEKARAALVRLNYLRK
ncbi:DUF4276 family protein [Chitinophaga sp.]|uniref:DUF4276 family protein n=1 Tax=Chitinophaga sp. TaxID=1869181 RepID=UPI0031D8972A